MEEKVSNFYAHSPQGAQQNFETIYAHSLAVAKKSSEFSKDFGFGELSELAGVLHDIGKYQPSFQKKIRGENCCIEHSNCGAKEVFKLLKVDKQTPINAFNTSILAYIIAGHHSGLPDCGTEADSFAERTLTARLKRDSEDYSSYKEELLIQLPAKMWAKDFLQYDEKERIFAFSILTRMLYSSLVDSDSLETEKFYKGKDRENNFSSFQTLKGKLDIALAQFDKKEKNKINVLRQKIQEECLKKSCDEKGLFSLTVPTGGGKTLSSMSFAINHLLKHGQKRIIYVIPYTTIIEQTAKVFKDIFGEENVVEHHSNFTYEDQTNEETPQFLATENWDAPIILTTNVQFFDSIFSNKRGSCRKLHNIANSVIIFDEAQMLPIPLLKPCLKTVDIFSRSFGCTAVLMSATCPNYLPYLCKGAKISELNDDYKQHYIDFKRTQAQYIGQKTDEEIINMIDKNSQTLVIVNYRKHAQNFFEKLPKDVNKYHLSTKMFPKHRKDVIEKIKQDLKDKKPCIVVSTQLIECGVDIDFEYVFRSLAGIDSIVQSAGRCNREGIRKNSNVYVFESPFDLKNGDIAIYKNLAREICVNSQNKDLLSLENINKYFEQLLSFKDKQTDEHNILDMFKIGSAPLYFRFDFQKCNDEFKYIDSGNKVDVIVPVDKNSQEQIEIVRENGKDVKLAFRKLNQYLVSVFKYEFLKLQKQGEVEPLKDKEGFYVLLNVEKNYDKNTGLILSNCESDKNLIF